jgi:hypothetical protein
LENVAGGSLKDHRDIGIAGFSGSLPQVQIHGRLDGFNLITHPADARLDRTWAACKKIERTSRIEQKADRSSEARRHWTICAKPPAGFWKMASLRS